MTRCHVRDDGPLVGPRVLLRQWTVDDVAVMADLVAANVEHLRPWMPWVAFEPLSPHDRRALIERWRDDQAAGGDLIVAIEFDGAPIGGAGLHARRGPDVLEIGYWIGHAHEGVGLVAETAALLTDHAFTHDGIDRVEIRHDGANRRSGRVPHRLGFEFVGATPDTPKTPGDNGVDCVWEMHRARWPGAAEALSRPNPFR